MLQLPDHSPVDTRTHIHDTPTTTPTRNQNNRLFTPSPPSSRSPSPLSPSSASAHSYTASPGNSYARMHANIYQSLCTRVNVHVCTYVLVFCSFLPPSAYLCIHLSVSDRHVCMHAIMEAHHTHTLMHTHILAPISIRQPSLFLWPTLPPFPSFSCLSPLTPLSLSHMSQRGEERLWRGMHTSS